MTHKSIGSTLCSLITTRRKKQYKMNAIIPLVYRTVVTMHLKLWFITFLFHGARTGFSFQEQLGNPEGNGVEVVVYTPVLDTA